MQDFRATEAGRAQPDLAATSFVIASPAARRVMESTFDAEYTFLEAGALGDDWWAKAIDTGLIGIGNHSWDHLHPALETVAHSRQVRADFTQVSTSADADAQIREAMTYINARTDGRAAPFFRLPIRSLQRLPGRRLLPEQGKEHGIARGVHHRTEGDRRVAKCLAAAALHVRTSLAKSGSAGGDPERGLSGDMSSAPAARSGVVLHGCEFGLQDNPPTAESIRALRRPR